MNRKIYILATASFAMGTEAYVFSGHLSALAADLGESVGAAGQLATAFAMTYAVTAPFIARAVSGFGRRGVIVAGLVLIGLINIAAAFAPSLSVLIGLRIACGLAAGLVGPMSSVAAAELAPEGQRGKAMAIVLGGMTLALLLGIPIGSVVGDIAGWRGTFVFAGGIALIAALAVRLVLPEMPGTEPASSSSAFKTALDPALAPWLALTLIGFAATFTAIAYVGPIVTAISGLKGSGVGAVQAMIGVGSIIGVVIGARVADRPGAQRAVVSSFVVSAAALAIYSVLMLMADPSIPMVGISRLVVIGVLCIGMMAGAAALFMRTPVIQTRLAAASPAAARPVILALNSSMVFAGQGLGAAIGGAAIGLAGLSSVGLVAAVVALLGAGLAVRLRGRPAPVHTSAG
jgi:MFS transporter, DHA1 family, inner membrane transport protein